MNYETKREVLEDLLDAYGDAITGGGQGDNSHPAEYRLRYAAAMPDDIPVIPKAWGDIIEEFKANHYRLEKIFTDALILNYDEQEVAARAWLLSAWRVEETGEIVKLEVKD